MSPIRIVLEVQCKIESLIFNKDVVVKQLEISMASFKITAINNFDASYFSYVVIFAYLSETSINYKKMALVIGHCQYKVMHHYIQDSSILTLSYPVSE